MVSKFYKDNFKSMKNSKSDSSKEDKIEKELKQETPHAYPFMIGTSPVTWMRRFLKKQKF